MAATEDIDAQLQSDEQLLWKGRPRAGFIFRPEQVPSIVVGGAMLLAALWMLAALFRDGFGWIGFVMFAVFAMVGLYLTYGIVTLDMRCRSSTCYAITDRRIIIQSDSPFVDVGSVPLLRLNGKPQTLKIALDGTINFGYPLFSHMARFWGPIHRMTMDNPRLDCLENPLQVYHVIRRAQRRLLSAGIDPD